MAEHPPASGARKGGLFVTGASGFVGRRLIAKLEPARFGRVVALVHRPGSARLPARPGLEVIASDLLDVQSYQSRLARCDRVVHLAAVTGKARPTEYQRTNAEGTRALVTAAQAASVRRFVHVSTIAARFSNLSSYPYAASKAEAERSVRASGLTATIVRPTLLVGPGAPVLEGLAKLACAPLTPIFGDGEVRIQPLDVDDLVDVLLGLAAGETSAGEVVELGGPETLTLKALLERIRKARGGGRMRPLHLPLAPTRSLLRGLEPILRPLLPITAGQLETFAQGGVAAPSALAESLRANLRPLDDSLTSGHRAALDEVARECRTLCHHLAGIEPDASVVLAYRRLLREQGLTPGDRFDARLLAIARRGRVRAALADGYAARFLPQAALRRRLVALVALLETSAAHFEALDAPPGPRGIAVLGRLSARAVLEIATALLAAAVFAPLHWVETRRDRA
ncbi:MAG: NAD-dependent epimerase/dehydratase family protein [Myxococcota bacterium]